MCAARLVLGFVVLSLASGCSGMLSAPCQKACYAQKTNEPRDFDDCIARCRK